MMIVSCASDLLLLLPGKTIWDVTFSLSLLQHGVGIIHARIVRAREREREGGEYIKQSCRGSVGTDSFLSDTYTNERDETRRVTHTHTHTHGKEG